MAVDTLAQDAVTGETSEGAKLLPIPQHNIVVAARGSGQFFLRVYQLCLEASFRNAFSIEQIMREVGPVMDLLWPKYVRAVRDANMDLGQLQSEIVVVGCRRPRTGSSALPTRSQRSNNTHLSPSWQGVLPRQVSRCAISPIASILT